MIAVDTNVIVRLLVADDPAQSRRARALLEKEDVWIGPTVLLETAWVLDAVYGFTPAAIARALRAVLGLPNVATSSPTDIARALEAAERGMDVADAFHLALAPPEAEAFVTFDRKVTRRGAALRTVRLA